MPSSASPTPATTLRADPYDYVEARRIAAALGLVEPIAVTLVRRGYRTVEAARRFLEAGDEHDPFEFEGMGEACELILSHARRGAHLTVHGDYDVDGVCSTAILVSTLRALGARCDWLIPDRLADGYGVTMAGIEELRRRGTELAITVDCGIGSADEVAVARAAGIEVVVTDHHEPPERLPDCMLLHPVVSGYPFGGLCAAGVAHKLASALRSAAGSRYTETVGGRRDLVERDLDLVALATVADLVPLIGENRRLVRQGLTSLRTRPRTGLRALMAAAGVEPETVDEGALGYRLAPRINAAGRLYRADAGVELMLTDDSERAGAIAAELDRANAERRAAEREVEQGAERARAGLPAEQATAPALVLAGEGWHPGVVGIAASRLAERHWRPTVLISLGRDRGRGSARGIPGFDLIAALDACSDHLLRHGGHRAAAGLEIERERVEGFRRAFLAYAAEAIEPADLVRTESIDALIGVGRGGIGMELAEQLERLGPFGKGNPDPRLVVPWGRLRSVRPLGEEGRHSRFDLESGAGRALGVAFGMNGELFGREDEAVDLSVRLELDRWNGAVQPRVVLRELHPLEPGEGEEGAPGCGSGACPAPAEEWWPRLGAEIERCAGPWWPRGLAPKLPGGPAREIVDRRGGAAVAALAELVSSGESVLALCADASRRRALARSAANPRRFGAGAPQIACGRCAEEALGAALGPVEGTGSAPPGLVLGDWGALARRPLAGPRFHHLVLIEPPPADRLDALVHTGPGSAAPFAPGFLHLGWGNAEIELAERCLAAEWMLRAPIAEIWRALRQSGGEVGGEDLRALLAGESKHPRSPEVAGRCLGVMLELELCEWAGSPPAPPPASWTPDLGAPSLRVLSSDRTELERSRAFTACVATHQEGLRYLRDRAQSG